MTDERLLKPLVWIGSAREDMRAFPEPVKDHIGYYVAQRGGRHRDTKTLSGFGGAGVVEVLRTFAATRSARYTPCVTELGFTSFTPSRRNRRLAAEHRAGKSNW